MSSSTFNQACAAPGRRPRRRPSVGARAAYLSVSYAASEKVVQAGPRSLSTISWTVAIMVLHPELAEAVGTERFLREVRITARLNYPHIPPLLDLGEANGLLFYSQSYFAEGLADARTFHSARPLWAANSPMPSQATSRSPRSITYSFLQTKNDAQLITASALPAVRRRSSAPPRASACPPCLPTCCLAP